MKGSEWSRFVAWAVLGGLVHVAPLAAQDAVLPAMVVVDGNGDTLGPMVSSEGLTAPIVRLWDDAVDVPVFVSVRQSDLLLGPSNSTFFSGPGCTGTPYHNPALDVAFHGYSGLTGFTYSVARIGGDQWLIRSSVTTGSASADIQSTYTSSNDSCSASIFTQSMRVAAAVLNLDAAHPPPYAIE